MRVLWFTNTPCSAVEKLDLQDFSGGWLKSLEKELCKNETVALGICFYSNKKLEPFKHNASSFFPVYREQKTKFGRLINNVLKVQTDKAEIEKFGEVIDLFKPDIIHVHGTEENFGMINLNCKIPMVISIQGILNPYSNFFFSGIPQGIAKKYESLKSKLIFNSIGFIYEKFKNKAIREQFILNNTKYVIGRTDWDKNVITILAPKAKYYLNNEILRDSFYNNTWLITKFNNPIQIITTISDNLYKGLETIINTAIILTENKNINFNWSIIGLNSNSETVRICNKWKNINLKDINIKLQGQLNEEEMIQLMLYSDLYVQVSHIENSPNSLCEAMLLGMPIIASFAGGTSSLITHEKEGLLYQSGDHYSLAGSIIALNRDYESASKMGEAAKERAMIRHDKEIISSSLLSHYYTIIKENNLN